MKMIYRRINKTLRHKVFGAIIVLLLIAAVFAGGLFSWFAKPVFFIATPFLNAKNYLSFQLVELMALFDTKEDLAKENRALEEKIEKMKNKILFSELLKKENKDLKNLLAGNTKTDWLVSSVISRPPQSPYDILIIDSGRNDGVQTGSVVIFDNVFIGKIEKASNSSSRVKLASFPEEEMNVMIFSKNLDADYQSAVAVGQGGGNFNITLPRDIEISAGNLIKTTGTNWFLLGIVEEVKKKPADAFQRILFRIPINIHNLNFVEVLLE